MYFVSLFQVGFPHGISAGCEDWTDDPKIVRSKKMSLLMVYE